MASYLLALDQGSSGSRAILVNARGKVVSCARYPLSTHCPRPGWVEHRPQDIVASQLSALKGVLRRLSGRDRVEALGLSAQRSTIILWKKDSGKPIAPAMSWQDVRGLPLCEKLSEASPLIRKKTGLLLTPYYAASKIRWALDHVKGARREAESGRLLCGSVSTYLLWHLTRGEIFSIDPTHAARFLLFNMKTLQWDRDLLTLFGIPPALLPRVMPTVGPLGTAHVMGRSLPILCSMGDQQAAVIGLGCFHKGDLALNYGTGGFVVLNTGAGLLRVPGLLSSILWSREREVHYCLEGTVNAAGSALDWVLTLLGRRTPRQGVDTLCARSQERITVIPAFSGLGAPYWKTPAPSCFLGLTRTTRQEDLVRGTVEAIAFLVRDIYERIRAGGNLFPTRLIAGGGLVSHRFLLQFQADVLQRPIDRTATQDASALGAAYGAGVGAGIWRGFSDIEVSEQGKTVFRPMITKRQAEDLYTQWKKAIAAMMRMA